MSESSSTSNQPILINQLSQTEQSGGYWLISGNLAEPLKTLHAFYSLLSPAQNQHTPQGGIKASLFDYQFPKLQLLTEQPIDLALFKKEPLPLAAETSTELSLQTDQPTLLLSSDLGVGPLLYCAKQVKQNGHKHLALLHTSTSQQFPFVVKPAQFMLNDFPFEAIGGCSLLEDWKIANRLASDQGQPGCLDGSILELITPWLEAEKQRQVVEPMNWQVVSFLPATNYQSLIELVKTYPWLSLKNYAI